MVGTGRSLGLGKCYIQKPQPTVSPSPEPEAWKLKLKRPYNLSCCCEEDINTSVQSGRHGSDNPAFVRAGQLTNCERDVSVYCAVQTQKDDKGTVNY